MIKIGTLVIVELVIAWFFYLVGVTISDSWVVAEWRTGLSHLMTLLFTLSALAVAMDWLAEGVE